MEMLFYKKEENIMKIGYFCKSLLFFYVSFFVLTLLWVLTQNNIGIFFFSIALFIAYFKNTYQQEDDAPNFVLSVIMILVLSPLMFISNAEVIEFFLGYTYKEGDLPYLLVLFPEFVLSLFSVICLSVLLWVEHCTSDSCKVKDTVFVLFFSVFFVCIAYMFFESKIIQNIHSDYDKKKVSAIVYNKIIEKTKTQL